MSSVLDHASVPNMRSAEVLNLAQSFGGDKVEFSATIFLYGAVVFAVGAEICEGTRKELINNCFSHSQ